MFAFFKSFKDARSTFESRMLMRRTDQIEFDPQQLARSWQRQVFKALI